MEFEYELTVPAGTTKTSPVSVVCQLSKGIIHHYEVAFLEGCNNLVSIAIFEGGFQCFPLNPDGAIKGNADPVEKATFYPLEASPYKVIAKGWSPDCTYDHTILLRFDVLPRNYFDKAGDIQAEIAESVREMQEIYSSTMEGLGQQLVTISELITPVPEELEEIPEASAAGVMEEAIDPLETLDQNARHIIEAQIRRGLKDGQIIDANTIYPIVNTELLPAIIKALRAQMEVY